jgi:hypothetical protein
LKNGIITHNSGKSYSALELARRIDSDFTVKERVVFRAEDFIEMIDIDAGKPPKGSVVVWDEAGVGIPSRLWWTVSNKAINFLLQTFRNYNICVIFTTPSFDFIDSQTRRLFHHYFETVRIMYSEEYVVVKPMNVEYSPRFSKTYFKFPNVNYRGQNIKVKELRIPKPPPRFCEEYEQIKKSFSRRLKEEVRTDIAEMNAAQQDKQVAVNQLVDAVIAKNIIKEVDGKLRLKIPDIMAEFGCGYPTAMLVRNVAMRKYLKLKEENTQQNK